MPHLRWEVTLDWAELGENQITAVNDALMQTRKSRGAQFKCKTNLEEFKIFLILGAQFAEKRSISHIEKLGVKDKKAALRA